jgi:MSHA biogenesis protein MshM
VYLSHFGLKELPFKITPDTGYAFESRSQRETLNMLLVAQDLGEGFIKVVGEVGTGKTLLCRRFLAKLPEDTVTAYVPNPALRTRALLLALARELGLDASERATEYELRVLLEQALLEHARAQRRVVIVLDEAQTLPLPTLEVLRLLSNLETEKAKLMQVALFGQPELDRRLARPSVRQLRQRIAFSARLAPMSEHEIGEYVEHRMRVAGYTGGTAFSDKAVRVLGSATGGVPRLVNIIANKSLMLAFGRGARQVQGGDAWEAARDTADTNAKRIFAMPAWAGIGLLGAARSIGLDLAPHQAQRGHA